MGNWQNVSHSLISFDLFQEVIPNTQNQIIKIIGKIILPENYSKYDTPRIVLKLNDEKGIIHNYPVLINKETNSFTGKRQDLYLIQ